MIPVGFEDTNKCNNSVVAPVESGTTASQAYAVGAHFIRNGAFCTAKSAIASGGTLTLDTNYTTGDIGGELSHKQISNSSISYDSTKITNVEVYRYGRIIFGTYRIAAGKLVSGYNGINFKLPYTWILSPVVSMISTSTADDAKVFGIIMSNSSSTGLNVRASAANTGAIAVYFIGCAI